MAQSPIQTQGRSNRGFSPVTDEQQDIPAPPVGGKIKGPGTGTSDSIPDRMRPGTFIVPADSVKVLGVDTLNKMANMPPPQGDFTPEQAHAAGIAFLTQLRDATHQPVTDATDGDADTEGPDDIDPKDTTDGDADTEMAANDAQSDAANLGAQSYGQIADSTDGDMDTEGPMDADIADDGSSRNFARGGMVGRNSAPGGQSWMIQHQGAGEGAKKLMSGNGGYANGGPVLGGYRYSELPTKDEINAAVGAKEQSEQGKLAQLQGTQIKDPFSWQAQAKAADTQATQKSLANLASARAVGNKQLQFGPGAGNLAGDSQGNAGAFALSEALQEKSGMRAGRPGDAGSLGPAQNPSQQFARGGMVRNQSREVGGSIGGNTLAQQGGTWTSEGGSGGGGGNTWARERGRYADGGTIEDDTTSQEYADYEDAPPPLARGFSPDGGSRSSGRKRRAGRSARGFKPQRFDGGGEVVDNPFNFYPQNSPDAGAGIYDGLGTELGSSGKFAQVPDGVIGQQPPKPTAPPPVATRGSPAGSAAAKDVQSPGISYTDNNQAAGQGIKDSWNKGNYGEAVGKTVAGTVGMFTTPLIDGAVHGGGAAWDGAKGFGRGIFGVNDAASASAAPKPKAESAPPPAPASNNYKAAADAESQAWSDQVATTDSLKQRLAEKGRDGMTNAEVGQANPDGVVTMKRQANGVMEFSGNNIKGPVSYADDQGQAIAGAGMRSKGFGRMDVAPAGANVVMGPNGSYAFSNDPAPSGGQQASQPRGDRGVPGSGQQGAAPDPMAGMSVEQRLQYAGEVAAAQTNARGAQIVSNAMGPANLREWNDLRSPVGIAKRNLEFDMKNSPPDRRTSDGKGGVGGGGTTPAQQAAAAAYGQLAANQFKGDGITEFDRQKYADGQARLQQQDAWGVAKDVHGFQKDERAYQDGAPSRSTDVLKAQQAQQLAGAYQRFANAKTPEERVARAEDIRVLTGKDKPEAWKATALSGGKDAMGNSLPGGALLHNPTTGESRYVGGGQGTGATATGGLPKVSTPQDLAALKSGDEFIDMNGVKRTKK